MDAWAPSLVCPIDDAMTSTAKEAVASTASGLPPRVGLTSTKSMTDSKPAHQHDDIKTFKKKYLENVQLLILKDQE